MVACACGFFSINFLGNLSVIYCTVQYTFARRRTSSTTDHDLCPARPACRFSSKAMAISMLDAQEFSALHAPLHSLQYKNQRKRGADPCSGCAKLSLCIFPHIHVGTVHFALKAASVLPCSCFGLFYDLTHPCAAKTTDHRIDGWQNERGRGYLSLLRPPRLRPVQDLVGGPPFARRMEGPIPRP